MSDNECSNIIHIIIEEVMPENHLVYRYSLTAQSLLVVDIAIHFQHILDLLKSHAYII